jgi:osmotically-inducible protein OsmY
MRYLYEVDLRDPSINDIVLNTEKLSIDAAVELVAGVLQRPELQTTPAGQQLVADRSLASQVQVALATNPETRKYRITVEARSGLVTLEGTSAMDEAVEVARSVRGVREVKTRQVDMPPIPPFVA